MVRYAGDTDTEAAGMSDTGFKVCEYRNVSAAYRRFLEPSVLETTLQPLIRLLDLADTARLVLRVSRRARKRDGVTHV